METQEPGFWRVVRSYIFGDINSGLPRERHVKTQPKRRGGHSTQPETSVCNSAARLQVTYKGGHSFPPADPQAFMSRRAMLLHLPVRVFLQMSKVCLSRRLISTKLQDIMGLH